MARTTCLCCGQEVDNEWPLAVYCPWCGSTKWRNPFVSRSSLSERVLRAALVVAQWTSTENAQVLQNWAECLELASPEDHVIPTYLRRIADALAGPSALEGVTLDETLHAILTLSRRTARIGGTNVDTCGSVKAGFKGSPTCASGHACLGYPRRPEDVPDSHG